VNSEPIFKIISTIFNEFHHSLLQFFDDFKKFWKNIFVRIDFPWEVVSFDISGFTDTKFTHSLNLKSNTSSLFLSLFFYHTQYFPLFLSLLHTQCFSLSLSLTHTHTFSVFLYHIHALFSLFNKHTHSLKHTQFNVIWNNFENIIKVENIIKITFPNFSQIFIGKKSFAYETIFSNFFRNSCFAFFTVTKKSSAVFFALCAILMLYLNLKTIFR